MKLDPTNFDFKKWINQHNISLEILSTELKIPIVLMKIYMNGHKVSDDHFKEICELEKTFQNHATNISKAETQHTHCKSQKHLDMLLLCLNQHPKISHFWEPNPKIHKDILSDIHGIHLSSKNVQIRYADNQFQPLNKIQQELINTFIAIDFFPLNPSGKEWLNDEEFYQYSLNHYSFTQRRKVFKERGIKYICGNNIDIIVEKAMKVSE